MNHAEQDECEGATGPISRRSVLGWGAAAAAAFIGRLPARLGPFASRLTSGTRTTARTGLPVLQSSPPARNGSIHRFRSRPDLAPAAIDVAIDRGGQDPGLIFLDSQGGIADEGPMIVDGAGELVWFHRVSADPRSLTNRAFNLRVQRWRNAPVLTWFDGSVASGHGNGQDVIMDTSYNEIARVDAGDGCSDDLHAFFLTDRGTALVTCYPLEYGDLSSVGGGTNDPYISGVVQEIDVATGAVLFEWRSDQHVAFGESYAPFTHGAPWDYFHVNSIDVARDGNLLISARCTWAVYKVQRQSGEIMWRLGGKKSDFAIGPGAHFAWQHDVNEQRDGSFTVFDNGAGDYRSEPTSRALVLNVDERTRRVSLKHQYGHPRAPLQAGALGSVQTLPGGHLFVGWGIEAAYTEFDASGKPVLDARIAGEGVQSYRAFRSLWSARPSEHPALAVAPAGRGALLIYASWNGATEVTHWLVLGGSHPSAMAPLGVAARRGFETVIDLPHHPPLVAAAALDAAGHTIGRSKNHTT
ncbi:MAG: arylsulfotransferase family protein [Actinomycetota bacterium]|nr:arylsulfotransferase family protein [Actinomycetota bacterium]